MALPNLINNGWLQGIPWAEHVGRGGSTGEASLGWETGNQASMTIFVYFTDAYAAVPLITGTNVFNRQTGNVDRVPPIQHPLWPALYASRVRLKGFHFSGKGRSAVTGGSYSQYTHMLINVTFTQPRHVVLTDTQCDSLFGTPGGVRQEWNRYVEFLLSPTGEYLTREANSFFWKETAAGGPPAAPNNAFPGTLSQFVGKAELILRWHRVPAQGLVAAGSGTPLGLRLPGNVLGTMGAVNNAPFLGFPTGTLLIKPPQFTAVEQPNSAGVYLPGAQPQLAYTVDFAVSQFDPPNSTSTGGVPGGGGARGHNLCPFPGTGASAGKWWEISSTSDGTGPGPFPYKDVTQLFRLTA